MRSLLWMVTALRMVFQALILPVGLDRFGLRESLQLVAADDEAVTAVVRLVGAVLAEQQDEWAVARRDMSADSLTKARTRLIDGELEEVTKPLAHVMQNNQRGRRRDRRLHHIPGLGPMAMDTVPYRDVSLATTR